MADIKVRLSTGDDFLILDKRNISSISSLSQLVSQAGTVSYNSLANTGEIELVDNNNEFLDKIKDFGNKQITVDIYLRTNNDKEVEIQKHTLTESQYDVSDKKASLILSDNIDYLNKNLGDIYIKDDSGIRIIEESSLYDLTVALFKELDFTSEQIDDMLTETLVRGDGYSFSAKDYFRLVKIKYPYLKADTSINNINKICSVAQVCFATDKNGKYKFFDSRNVFLDNEQVVFVPFSRMFSPLKFDPLSKTTINSVGYTKNESTYNYEPVQNIKIANYQQTEATEPIFLTDSGATISAYSGLEEKYTTTSQDSGYKTISNDNATLVGVYSGYMSGRVVEGAKYLIYKVSLPSSKISNLIDWKINLNSANYNQLIRKYNPRTKTSTFLQNVNRKTFTPSLNIYLANNEKEALSQFGAVDSDGNLIGVYPQSFNVICNRVAVVCKDTTIDVYHAVAKRTNINSIGVSEIPVPSNYTGTLDYIYLDTDLDVLLRSVETKSVKVNELSDYNLSDNEIMNKETTFDGMDIYTVQTNNLIEDYSSGILTATVTVSCLDYYDEKGTLLKDWSNGQTLSVGDIITIESDKTSFGQQRYWKITGAKFVYDSSSMLELELLEAKKKEISISAGLYNEDNELVETWNALVASGAISQDGYTVTASNPDKINGRLVLPKNIYSISTGAFENCSGLTDVELTSVTSILDRAFKNCTSITNLKIPKYIISIGEEAFYGLTSLERIEFNARSLDLNMDYSLLPNNNVFSYAGHSGSGIEVVFGDEVVKVPKYLFNPSTTYSDRHPNIKSVQFGKNIKSIEPYAFKGCANLAKINSLPDLLEEIGSSAFSGCSSLSGDIVVPDSVYKLGDYAFSKCSINSVDLGTGFLEVPEYCFNSCPSLVSVKINNQTSIGSNAFAGCSSLQDIELPNTIIGIGDSAFSSCIKLKDIVFPESIISIGENAFYACISFSRISLPTSLKTLSNKAFSGCSGIKEIFIPSTISSMGSSVFYNFYPTAKIYIDSDYRPEDWSYDWNKYYSGSSDFLLVVYGWTKEQFDSIPYFVLEELESSGYMSVITFTGQQSDIRVPENVYVIQNNAFNGNTNIERVVLPSTLKYINESAFYGCSNLKEINFPYALNYISSHAFNGCSSLTDIEINEKLRSINLYAFSGCKGIKTVYIPTTVTTINSEIFSGCSDLVIFTDVVDENSVPSGWDDYWNCYSLPYECRTVYGVSYEEYLQMKDIGYAVVDNEFVYYFGDSEEVAIPSGVTTIADEAFEKNTTIKSVTIPNTTTKIGYYTFNDCSNLETVKFEATSTLNYVDSGAFRYCSKLKNFSFPSTVTQIGSNSFSFCTSLESAKFPSGLTNIPSSAFEYSGLKEISIPNTVTSIGSYAFSFCEKATKITIPSSISKIESGTFHSCELVTSVNIPDSVTSIEYFAFGGCYSLTDVTIGSGVTSIGSSCFSMCPINTITVKAMNPPSLANALPKSVSVVYIPAGTLSAYESATNWSASAGKFVEV